MQTWIALVRLTDKGRVEIAESLKRGEYAQEIMERNGVEMREYYLTIGAYDFVLIFDAQHERGMAQTLVESDVSARFAPRPCWRSARSRTTRSRSD